MYCPACKVYEATEDFNPVDNIRKFMRAIESEKEKLFAKKRRKEYKAKKRLLRGEKLLKDDSVSDITDLEEKEVLHRYYDSNMTKAERRAHERKIVQARLYGKNVQQDNRHTCK